jgi:hypothetical protein
MSGTHHHSRRLKGLRGEVRDTFRSISRRVVPLFERSRVAESIQVRKLGHVAENRRRFARG